MLRDFLKKITVKIIILMGLFIAIVDSLYAADNFHTLPFKRRRSSALQQHRENIFKQLCLGQEKGFDGQFGRQLLNLARNGEVGKQHGMPEQRKGDRVRVQERKVFTFSDNDVKLFEASILREQEKGRVNPTVQSRDEGCWDRLVGCCFGRVR